MPLIEAESNAETTMGCEFKQFRVPVALRQSSARNHGQEIARNPRMRETGRR